MSYRPEEHAPDLDPYAIADRPVCADCGREIEDNEPYFIEPGQRRTRHSPEVPDAVLHDFDCTEEE